MKKFLSRIKQISDLDLAHKFGIRIVYIEILIIFLVLAYLAYWTFLPIKVFKVKKLPVPVTAPENIKSGRIIVLLLDYCKYKDFDGYTERKLVSDRVISDLPPYKERMDVGCGKMQIPLILPYTVATQRFHIHYKISYKVNPLRTEIVEFDTADFDILPAPFDVDSKQDIRSVVVPARTPVVVTPPVRIISMSPLPSKMQKESASPNAGSSAQPTSAPQDPIQSVVETIKNLIKGVSN